MNIILDIELTLLFLVVVFILFGILSRKKETTTTSTELQGKPPIEPEQQQIKTTVEPVAKSPSWFSLLRNDLTKIWGDHGVRIFESNDGNILYVPVQDVLHWSPEEIVFWILVHEDEVYQKIKSGSAEVDLLKNWEKFVSNLTTTKVLIEFRNLNVIPTYHKAIQCWKLVLEDLPEVEQVVKDVIVEEIK